MSAVVEYFEVVPRGSTWTAEFWFYYNGVPYNFSYPNSMSILTSSENAAKMEYERHIFDARTDFLKSVHIAGEMQ